MELLKEHRKQEWCTILEANHKLYFDNYFTTYNLLELLTERKIHAAGTARVSRFARPPLQWPRSLEEAAMKLLAMMVRWHRSNDMTTDQLSWPKTLWVLAEWMKCSSGIKRRPSFWWCPIQRWSCYTMKQWAALTCLINLSVCTYRNLVKNVDSVNDHTYFWHGFGTVWISSN